MDKDKIISLVMAIGFSIGVLTIGFVFSLILIGINDNGINKTETICDELGLDVLSVSRQVFGDDYVVCYNKVTNETRRIVV